MRYILSLVLLFTLSVFAQSNPDQKLNDFSTSTAVNAALVKAQAAVTGSGTANQITYWTGTGTIGSLATTTYPNLTQFSYLRGVTSPIQTQLNSKQATLISGTNIKTINGQSILGTGNITVTFDTTGLWLQIYNMIKAESVGDTIIGGKATLDSMIIDFRKNNYLRLNK